MTSLRVVIRSSLLVEHARAASMVALSASRLVCSAIAVIDDVADTARGLREFGDAGVSLLRLLDRLGTDLAGLEYRLSGLT
jgi:hypothetical protein